MLSAVLVTCKAKTTDYYNKNQLSTEHWISRKIALPEGEIAATGALTVLLAEGQESLPPWLKDKGSMRLLPEAKNALLHLLSEANKEAFRDSHLQDTGYHLTILSGFKDFSEASSSYEEGLATFAGDLCEGDRQLARPGHSEHHLGTAVDFALSNGVSVFSRDTFHGSSAANWLANQAHRFGFVMSFPQGKEPITGMVYQPWHYRYVGAEAAALIWKNRWSIEEYMHSVQQKSCDAVVTSQQTLFMLELPQEKITKSDWETLVQTGKALSLPKDHRLILNHLAGVETTNPQAAFADAALTVKSCLIDEGASGRSSAYWYRGEYLGVLGYVSYLHADCSEQVITEDPAQVSIEKVEVERLLAREIPGNSANPLANTIPIYDHPTSMNEIGFARAASEIHALEILEGPEISTKPCTPMFERGIKSGNLMYRVLNRGIFGRNDPLTGQRIDLNAVAEMYVSETDVLPFNYLQGASSTGLELCNPASQPIDTASSQLQKIGIKKFAVKNFANRSYRGLDIGSFIPVYGDSHLETLVGYVAEGKNYYFTARTEQGRQHRPALACSHLAKNGSLSKESFLLYDSERLRVHFLDARDVRRPGLWIDETFLAESNYLMPADCVSDSTPADEGFLPASGEKMRVNDPRRMSEDKVEVFLDVNLSIPAGTVKNHGLVKIVAQRAGRQQVEIPSCTSEATSKLSDQIYAVSPSDVVPHSQYKDWRGDLWISAAFVQSEDQEAKSCPQKPVSDGALWENDRLKSFNNKMLLPVATHLLGSSTQDYHQGHYRGLSAGWDLVAPYGTEVLAMAAGRILYAGCNQGPLGCMVLYEAGPMESGEYQYQVMHGHLTPESVQTLAPGQILTQQSVLGAIGCTGHTNYGPHLYVQVRSLIGVPMDMREHFSIEALEQSHFKDVDGVVRYLVSPETEVQSQLQVPLAASQPGSRLCQRDTKVVQAWQQARTKHMK